MTKKQKANSNQTQTQMSSSNRRGVCCSNGGSLVADSMAILMQRSPKELDHSLPEAYQKVMQLEGVQGVHETHFWTLCTNFYCGGEDRPGRHRGSVE